MVCLNIIITGNLLNKIINKYIIIIIIGIPLLSCQNLNKENNNIIKGQKDSDIIFELRTPRMNGKNILNLQKRLLLLGFNGTGDADGYYGPSTEDVIKIIQIFSGFESDGKVNKILFNFIFDDNNSLFLRNISIVSEYDKKNLEKTGNLFGLRSGPGELIQLGFVYYSATDRKAKIFEYYSSDESINGSITCYFVSEDYYFLISDTLIYERSIDDVSYYHGVYLVSNNNIFEINNGVLKSGFLSGGWDGDSILYRINSIKNNFIGVENNK